MASVEQGWNALQSGNFSQSAEHFNGVLQRDPTSFPALSGLARLYILTGNLEQAQAVAELAAHQTRSAASEALLGEVIGLRGNRANAEQHLLAATKMQPSVALYGVLLGEQQVRQGRWQDGTDSILQALQVPDDGRAITALQNMIADLIDAIIVGRLTEVDGMKFINRLDYSMSAKSSELGALFGAARRSIHARQPLARAQQRVVIPQNLGSAPKPEQQPVQQQYQQQRSQPAQQRSIQPQHHQAAPPAIQSQYQPQSQKTQKPSPARSQSTATSSSDRERLAERNRPSTAVAVESRPLGDKQNMMSIMHEERLLNQAIQNMVPAAVPPQWPSLVENPIDQIPPIGMDSRNILGGVTGLAAADFRLTGGDITIEIVLERCLHNLLAATQTDKVTTLPFRPTSIARLELNMRDGLLERMEPMDSLYIEETKINNHHTLALGRFLGDCIVQTYGGVWAYEHPPEASFIHLGKGATLRPFALAKEWIDADDIDDVILESITSKAKQAMADYAMLSTVVSYSDPTPGLDGSALSIKLADLWIEYRFIMREAELQEVTDAIHIIEQDSKIILFSINARWTPDSATGHQNHAVTPDGNVYMAYVRSTGEFLLLGSRKHFARYVSLRWDALTPESVGEVGVLLANMHLPATKLIKDDNIARKINDRMNSAEVSAPRFVLNGNDTNLTIWFYKGNSAFQYQLTYSPNELVPCKLQILKTLST